MPKYYLKNFAIKNGKRGKKRKYFINVYDNVSGHSFFGAIDTIAYEDYYYEAPDNPQMYKDGKPVLSVNEVEDFLGKLESLIAPRLDKLITLLDSSPETISTFLNSEENRMWIGLHYLLQFYRTKNWKQHSSSLEKENLKQILLYKEFYHGWNEARYRKNLEILNEFSTEKASWKQIIKLLDLEDLNRDLNQIGNYVWSIGENNSKINIVTSDCPIILFDYFPDDSKTYYCSYLPLSPRYCLIIYHEYFITSQLKHLNSKMMSLNETEVKKFNSLLKDKCSKFLFSQQPISKDHFQ
ncbi:DUF4238 domain-containing protein [Paenisporosarcina macmurdoensis]|uniref:DUF4238 domain-containing protein n=1 Tax=Paenisporosarcina macmurdoensis TaxID=212659 RepID=A0ABW1L937_9BACL